VRFYPSAAAAEAAGFRPCLRCRPETAPFCPAWNGSRTTAERALRLIEGGALDEEEATVEALAARVGVGARHLSRLFARHVGASPAQVARTARVQRAKRLLDGTDLAMAEVALRAGFRSLRRFNAVFAEVYRRPPTTIRGRHGEAIAATASSSPNVGGPESPVLGPVYLGSRYETDIRNRREQPFQTSTEVADDHAFCRFQNTGEEPLTMPDRLLRQALGVNHCPVGR
jgi:AraC family transcriptional regulator of adaptative response / DNA-3-methyladenine glycosylase II